MRNRDRCASTTAPLSKWRRSPRACPTLQRCLSASCRSDVLRFILPSRYCESDALMRMAVLEFGTLTQGAQRVEAICVWIRDHIKYEIGTTQATHSAFDTVTGRVGVCRDFAHLAIAFCRALNIPARFVTGYATFADPPPDFHAVFEAYLGGRWHLFDPTGLALRSDQVTDRYRARRRGRRFRDHLRARAHDLHVPAHRAHRHATTRRSRSSPSPPNRASRARLGRNCPFARYNCELSSAAVCSQSFSRQGRWRHSSTLTRWARARSRSNTAICSRANRVS